MHQQQNPNVPQAHPLKFRNLVRGRGGPKEAVNDVIDDAEELEDYARDCTGEEDRKRLAEVKPRFEREKVIAVAIGQRPTPAYEIEIVSVVQITGGFVGLQTQIHYVLRTPHGPATPPDALTAPAYPHHVVRVKNAGGLIIFRDVTPVAAPEPPAPPAPPHPTTLALGEEDPRPTTLALGEETPGPTTLALGEETPGPTTLAVGEETPHPTTLALGEEDPRPTTLALGEEAPPPPPQYTTMMVGEEVWPHPTTLAVGEESATRTRGPEDPTTLATGEEGGTGPTTMATGEESFGGGRGPFGGF